MQTQDDSTVQTQEVDDMNVDERGDDNEISNEQEDVEEDDDDDIDWRKLFHNVLTHINLDRLKAHALDIRRQRADLSPLSAPALACEIGEEPFHGSYNLVYVIDFSDGVKWVARVPIQGARVEEADIHKLNTDYTTLSYIHRAMKLAVPEVFTFETTCERIGVPFALMAFIGGTSVCDRWDDNTWITEDRRIKILTNLAYFMAKLQEPRFEKVGTLRFSTAGTVSHIGPLHSVIEVDEEYIEEGKIHVSQIGPFESAEDWLHDGWDDLVDVSDKQKPWHRGCLEVMRLAMQSIPTYLQRPNRCTIDMWDFNYQNIYIDEDCNITGIIDWDGIRAVPEGMGCTSYPSWITRDWDPGSYDPPTDGDWSTTDEDPPEALSKYRKHYADVFASLELKDYDLRETRLSHILEAIKLGVGDRFARQYIYKVLLNHAYNGTNLMLDDAKSLPYDSRDICIILGGPNTSKAKNLRKQLLKRFEMMWRAEWEPAEAHEQKRESLRHLRYLPRLFAQKENTAFEGNSGNSKRKRTSGYVSRFLTSKQARIISILKR